MESPQKKEQKQFRLQQRPMAEASDGWQKCLLDPVGVAGRSPEVFWKVEESFPETLFVRSLEGGCKHTITVLKEYTKGGENDLHKVDLDPIQLEIDEPALTPHIAKVNFLKISMRFCSGACRNCLWILLLQSPCHVIDEQFNSILPNCYLMLMIRIINQHQSVGHAFSFELFLPFSLLPFLSAPSHFPSYFVVFITSFMYVLYLSLTCNMSSVVYELLRVEKTAIMMA
ncbi:hypothetical protein VNO77_13433 [Canavalia gladiata]|uniref:Uncharacterized protein n=1 Tax=Canavalia gladiata TaxID=3824 RepID=A0AAN9LXZ3_CANGL